MKKPYLFSFLLVLFTTNNVLALPDEILEIFDEIPSIKNPDTDVTFSNHIFSVKINKSVIQRNYAKFVVSLICEDYYFEPQYWNSIDFKMIEVRNSSNNSGYRMEIDKQTCRSYLKRDLSEAELERQVFKYQLKKF